MQRTKEKTYVVNVLNVVSRVAGHIQSCAHARQGGGSSRRRRRALIGTLDHVQGMAGLPRVSVIVRGRQCTHSDFVRRDGLLVLENFA